MTFESWFKECFGELDVEDAFEYDELKEAWKAFETEVKDKIKESIERFNNILGQNQTCECDDYNGFNNCGICRIRSGFQELKKELGAMKNEQVF